LLNNGRTEKIQAKVDSASEDREVDQKGDNDVWQQTGIIAQCPDAAERGKKAPGKVDHEISLSLHGHYFTSFRVLTSSYHIFHLCANHSDYRT
jgi:hypothetical protein